MTWTAVRATDEDGWTEEYLGEILSTFVRRPLPPPVQRIGSTEVSWVELFPGTFTVTATGGTTDDRRFARIIVGSQLRNYGLEEATFTAGGPTLRKQADWNDIMQKARRLVETGQITIGQNSPDHVTSVVEGDHGKYECEINRQDPNSGAITTWSCTCPWNQFAWQRTRKWKPLEGRMCSHVLGSLWQASTMPLDQEYDPNAQAMIGPGGQLGFDAPGMAPTGQGTLSPSTAPAPAATDQQLSIPGIAPGAAEALPPAPPGKSIIPPFNPPLPTPVSIPGGKQPDPYNPIQSPGGTFSSVKYPMDLDEWVRTAKTADWDFSDLPEDSPLGHKFVYNTADGKGIVANQDEGKTYHLNMEMDMGGSSANNHGGVVTPDGVIYPYYWPGKRVRGSDTNTIDENRYPPRLVKWIQEHIPHAHVPTNSAELRRGDGWGERLAATGDTFNNSDMVRINVDEQGIAIGKSEAHGSGQYRLITKNSIGEVLGQDPTTNWVDIVFPIHDSGPMEPYMIRAWVDPKDLTPMPGIAKPGPMIRRQPAR